MRARLAEAGKLFAIEPELGELEIRLDAQSLCTVFKLTDCEPGHGVRTSFFASDKLFRVSS
jgi:hypothetical protein